MRLPLPGKYYYEALLLAHENGVVGNPDMDPHGPCTREEIVTCPVDSAGGDVVKSVTSLYPKRKRCDAFFLRVWFSLAPQGFPKMLFPT